MTEQKQPKLYDPVKMKPLGPATQLPPTAETPRPQTVKEGMPVVDHTGGGLKRVKPQKK